MTIRVFTLLLILGAFAVNAADGVLNARER